MQVLSPRSDEPTPCIKTCIKTNTDKKQWQIMVSLMSISSQGWMGFISRLLKELVDVIAGPFSIVLGVWGGPS